MSVVLDGSWRRFAFSAFVSISKWPDKGKLLIVLLLLSRCHTPEMLMILPKVLILKFGLKYLIARKGACTDRVSQMRSRDFQRGKQTTVMTCSLSITCFPLVFSENSSPVSWLVPLMRTSRARSIPNFLTPAAKPSSSEVSSSIISAPSLRS